MNYDHTLLLKFELRKNEGSFDQALSFYANDYDSNTFEEKDGKIVFHSEQEGYTRKKICGPAKTTPEEVQKIFKRFKKPSGDCVTTTIGEGLLKNLEDGLSHVEFQAKKGKSLKMIQRNIYTGSVIEIEKKSGGLFKDSVPFSFGPIAIKTNDLLSLFAFGEKALKFSFLLSKGNDYIIIESLDKAKRSMVGIIACCLYDEIIEIQESKQEKDHGRKEQKVRRRKS